MIVHSRSTITGPLTAMEQERFSALDKKMRMQEKWPYWPYPRKQ